MRVPERQPGETGRNYALRTIRENIISLELAPGSMVSESELAAQLGLSRTPVREALIELSRLGVVKIFPQKGSQVSLIDYTSVEESSFARLVLEKAVARQACQEATPEDEAVLQQNLQLQKLCLQGDYGSDEQRTMLRLDNAFHGLLFAACHKQRTWQVLENYMLHFDRVRRMSMSVTHDAVIYADHDTIYKAVCRHDPDAAEAAMAQHLNRYQLDREEICRANPQYFQQLA